MTVLERGWLSANSVLFTGPDGAALVDTGYCIHAEQTLDLVRSALGREPLARILNTHLHSDHCGGNAALQAAWPGVHTAIAPGQAACSAALPPQWSLCRWVLRMRASGCAPSAMRTRSTVCSAWVQ